MRLAIQKLGYSRSPWRLVDLDRDDFGRPVEIAVPVEFDHPTCGRTVIDEPVMGNSKTEVVERTLDLLARLIEQRSRQLSETAGGRSGAEPQ